MGLRDGAAGLLDLLYLFVEGLLPLAPELPLHEAVGEARHVVPDVDDVKLRTALAARSVAASVACLAASEPSVASRILVGNTLISHSSYARDSSTPCPNTTNLAGFPG
jgi:hypothetical protein